MELAGMQRKILPSIGKFKYVIVVLLLGLILLLLPDKTTDNETVTDTTLKGSVTEETPVCEQLETILSQIKGVGKVSVMVTVASGEETVYQTDDRYSGSENMDTTDKTTVIVTDEKRNQSGLVKEVRYPEYRGAIIVCDGAGDPTVRLSIVEAVSKVTGLRADKISVLSRK